MKICGVDIRYFCGVLIKKDVSNDNLIEYAKKINYSDTIVYNPENVENGFINYYNKINYSGVINYRK